MKTDNKEAEKPATDTKPEVKEEPKAPGTTSLKDPKPAKSESTNHVPPTQGGSASYKLPSGTVVKHN